MYFYKKIYAIFVLLFVVGCGKDKIDGLNTDTSTEQPDDVIVGMSMKMTPPTDMFYVQSNDSAVYTATGDGGVGEPASFGKGDSLNLYTGIPVSIVDTNNNPLTLKNNQLNVSINVNGDAGCKLSFDYPSSQIKIDASQIKTLTVCHVQVSASANIQGISTKTPKTSAFDITLNPTLKAYFLSKPQDKFVQRWVKGYTGNPDDFAGIARWIESTPTLNLNWPFSNTDSLDQINAIIGAKNITSLDLTNAKVKDLSALQYLPNLQTLNISNTGITLETLAQLGSLPKLTSLIMQNMSLYDLNFIVKIFKNLTTLDVSNNPKLIDLSPLKDLKNLTTLVVKKIGLTGKFRTYLNGLTQITSLDLSNNELSALTETDAEILAELPQLKELNVSETKISDAVLNKYFSLISVQPILKKFVDRNTYNRKLPESSDNPCTFNRFSDDGSGITAENIELITSLEYLDVHGNSCLLEDGETVKGITNLGFISQLINLKYLDFSNNAITNLDVSDSNPGVSPLNKLNIPSIETNLIMTDLGTNKLMLTVAACQQQLLATSSYYSKCFTSHYPTNAY